MWNNKNVRKECRSRVETYGIWHLMSSPKGLRNQRELGTFYLGDETSQWCMGHEEMLGTNYFGSSTRLRLWPQTPSHGQFLRLIYCN